ncbi:MAG: TonB-dependent receptor [Hyphomonas sp.]|uniref:TonB-dependent receptor n=1 Tax=Hyphomonas sp. TaxID=87 RepID=UPI003527765F
MTRSYRAFLALGVASASLVGAASADVITGQVTDATGEAPLQGAIVTIEGLGRTASSDRSGNYRFANVPAGDYTLSVSYVGADTTTAEVSLAGTATLDFQVGSDVRYLDNILVVGSTAAQAGAINQQRASNAIISVVDSDGLGNFPDTTVADSLGRVPGLSIENDQGEGRYVSIRGINTDLISSSINGVRTPSPEDRRGVLLDGVPSDLLDGIEVQKSLTPDVDADTLGGVINMKTISAFDRDGRFVRAKLEGSYNEITEEISPKATFTYTNTFGDKLGVAFSANYQDLRIQSHNNETGGWDLFDGADFEVPQAGEFYAPADDYEMRWYDLTRERIGVVLNVDYRASENTELYLRTLLNQYTDDEIRNKFEFREMDEEIVSATDTTVAYRRGEVDAEVRKREEVRNIQTYAVGGNTFTGPWTFDYELSYAHAEEDDSNNHDVAFRSAPEQRDSVIGSIVFDYSNPQKPVITGPAVAFLYDPANYVMDAFEREYTTTEDDEWTGKIDVAREAMLGNTPVTWKGGVKLRDRQKVRDQNLDVYELDDVFLTDYITDNAQIPGWRMSNPMFAWPSAGLTTALRNIVTDADLNEGDTNLESISGDYTIDEQVLAFYGMGTFEAGDLTTVIGVRVERTNVDSFGFIYTEGDTPADATRRTFSDEYTNVLPSVNLKYAMADNVFARAAYYAAVVRPGFGEMAPRVLFNEDRDEIEMGNPALSPYEADNYDLSIEYYPTKLSIISAGLFFKEIDNAIFPATFDIDELPAGIDLSFLDAATVAGLAEVSTYVNAGKSKVKGVEFNYVQELSFLGDAFDGFLASANLTLADSDARLPDGRKVPLLKQNDKVWNVALGYDKGPWDLRISANYRGAYLDELFGTNLDRYTDEHLSVEASAKYDVNDHIQVYLEGKNLGDEPEYYYHGSKSRLSQYDEFGWSGIFGVRLTY